MKLKLLFVREIDWRDFSSGNAKEPTWNNREFGLKIMAMEWSFSMCDFI